MGPLHAAIPIRSRRPTPVETPRWTAILIAPIERARLCRMRPKTASTTRMAWDADAAVSLGPWEGRDDCRLPKPNRSNDSLFGRHGPVASPKPSRHW